MIQLRAVSRTFSNARGAVEALRDIELHATEGEFVAVVGRSGCGKSTLLRLIAWLLPPSSGEVLIGGRTVTAPRRDVTLLFQRPAPLPWRSMLDNVLLPVEIARLPRAEYRDSATGPSRRSRSMPIVDPSKPGSAASYASRNRGACAGC
ncbi:MAG: NitT/TauT family transport system ATP-binding protein [Streptomycetaceae bacterium]|nr:NitT/TauT family transport system ATP-binding protein [Streptomycetaceae bacterium]